MKTKPLSFTLILLASLIPMSVYATSILHITKEGKENDEQTQGAPSLVQEDIDEQENVPLTNNESQNSEENPNKISSDIPLVEGPSAHLSFHIGLSAEGQNFVGGSIENRGKVAVHGGYVVILPIDEKCNPLTPILQPFAKIPSGEILSFRAPVEQSLSAYRVVGFNAYDDMGFPIEATDDTLKIISKRIPEERKACEKKRIQ